MKILLTNDDGIMSEGLQVLVSVLEKEHEVWVVAPDRNRSAVSHSILMDIPLKIKKKRNDSMPALVCLLTVLSMVFELF